MNRTRTRIFWTDAEIVAVAEEAARLRLLDPQPTLLTILKQAQSVLFPDRRRNLQGLHNVPDVVDKVMLQISLVRDKVAKPPLTQEQVLAGMTGESLVSLGIGKITNKAVETATAMLVVAKPTIVPAPAPSVSQYKSLQTQWSEQKGIITKTKVTVCGLEPGQINFVKEAVGSRLDLRFISTKVQQIDFGSADKAVLWTDFINHKITNQAMSQLGKDKVRLHKGGLKGLIELLKQLQ